MEENDSINLDLEYKRYLQILRPYLAQLIDNDVISICNAWIHKLSDCGEKEKVLRNKYIFSLCYQLARGALEDPFLKYPPGGKLPRISESLDSIESSTDVECYVVNAEDPKTEVLFDCKQEPLTDTEYLSQSNDFGQTKTGSRDYDSDVKSSHSNSKRYRRQTVVCYTCPEILRDFINHDSGEIYEHRANNLIKKLRDIKTQNTLLHNELLALKEESATQHNSFAEESIIKIDRATSALLQSNESSATLKSLKFRLQEVQDSRNSLIDKIAFLQETINNINDMKKHDIEDMEAKHKLEIINMKEAIRHEMKITYEKNIEDLKLEYESKIESLKSKSADDIQILLTSKNDVIEEKSKVISAKDKEISKLNEQIDDLKNHLHAILEKYIDKPTSSHSVDDIRFKAEQLEKKLNRMEKNKIKCTRIYETKLVQMQRDKHLAESSLQLQMVRQRAQVVNETTDENQVELTAALSKLETKYKEIVANMQATAIQRRMQDQMALESILQAACSISSENNSPIANGKFSKTMRNQNPSFDSGIPPLSRGNKVGNICIGNKSYTEDSVVTGYCLNGERMGELFERVYIPQRDSPETMK